ncbi:hypothetical protein GGI04_000415 [Coemansia thaxteri]|uniref:Uncharacterized protein n=1 Tax=Coemansia thaxteri TaxID=2663907 RepID=A0A9W8EHU6_9FUNG|nr:hypothetical protein H4R26_003195 [Coemansia thaxteri]KAJ2009505.1 hypothetical protein GGI04_000415 [Coemansia thaxteri]KAJ2473871.1 hypothetical protein GGI02_000549 [Coemansia sp. RSA 2322]KAJ2480492.1 hypothetical protein EV174_003715 [Coemansia sp. RSA 2320]
MGQTDNSEERQVVRTTAHTADEWAEMFVGRVLVEYPEEMKPEPYEAEDAEAGDAEKSKEDSTEEAEEAEEPKTVKWAELPQPVRIIWPRSRVTRDLRPQRLNLMCNANDEITRIAFY